MGGSVMKYTESIAQTEKNALRVKITFTRSGWRQFSRLNRQLGARFIRAFVLKRELALYIAAYESAGKHLDTECQELRYEDRVYLLLRRSQGVWFITDMFVEELPEHGASGRFVPVYFWTQIKRGCSLLLAHVLIGWKRQPETAAWC